MVNGTMMIGWSPLTLPSLPTIWGRGLRQGERTVKSALADIRSHLDLCLNISYKQWLDTLDLFAFKGISL